MGNGNQARRAMWAAALLATTAMAGVVWTSPVQAQDVARRAFDIPAQPLPSALTLFGQQSGLQVSVPAALAQGRTSAAVSGSMAPLAALGQLLAGTGLTYRISGNIVTLEPAPQTTGGAIQLGPVRVEGEGASSRESLAALRADESPLGPGNGFIASRTTSTKSNAPIIETPQSISVVTREQMDAQGAQTIREALRYSAGVVARDSTDNRFDALGGRGFGLDEYLDGLKLIYAGTYINPRIDPFFLDRIEVVRGPDSVLFGQASPGGLVNFISKRPTDTPLHEIELQGGSFGLAQAGVDLSGPLNGDGTLSGRITALARTAHTPVPFTRNKRLAIAPALTFKPTDRTSITLLGSYQYDPAGGFADFLPAVGTVVPAPRGRMNLYTNTGDPSFDSHRRWQYSVGYVAEHKISDNIGISQTLRYQDVKTEYRQIFPLRLLNDGENLLRAAFSTPERLHLFNVDTRATLNLDTGPIGHTILAGVDYQAYGWRRLFQSTLTDNLNIFRPVYGVSVGPLDTDYDQRNTLQQAGVYVQDQLSLGGFRALAGIRRDWATTITRDNLLATRATQDDAKTTGRLGLLYLTDFGLAPYVSYSTSFQPLAQTDFFGNALKPTTGSQIEGGLKYQPANVNAWIAASVYQLIQQNVATADPDPTHEGAVIQTGEVRSQGIEIEAKANLDNGLSLLASYAHVESKIRKSNYGDVGKSVPGVAGDSASLYVRYNLDHLTGSGITLGAGVRMVGGAFVDSDNTFKVGASTLLDLDAEADLSKWLSSLKGTSLSLNINNVAGKDYITNCSSLNRCFAGLPREFRVTLRRRW